MGPSPSAEPGKLWQAIRHHRERNEDKWLNLSGHCPTSLLSCNYNVVVTKCHSSALFDFAVCCDPGARSCPLRAARLINSLDVPAICLISEAPTLPAPPSLHICFELVGDAELQCGADGSLAAGVGNSRGIVDCSRKVTP